MSYAETMDQLNAKRGELARVRSEMRALQAQVEPQLVDDYVLAGWNGAVRLSELFAGKRDLIVIHNMGAGCPACTMWADGFNGVYDHLASRAAFVLASPNPVEAQKAFAAGRGWRFPMVSYEGSRFAEDMGYRHRGDDVDEEQGGWNPGVSAFRKDEDGRIWRLSDAEFGGDDDMFCVVWHLFDLFPDGAADFRPRYKYQ
jgi:predicted dithiol-disulfide oxidoreductase (DUF899 family)